jgi:transcriptional regulator with XRE-family HTH domain
LALPKSTDPEMTEAESVRHHVGVVIRWLREEKKWSQVDLAAASGVTRVSIGLIERGNMNASIDVMLSICGALSTSLLYVLAMAEAHASYPESESD